MLITLFIARNLHFGTVNSLCRFRTPATLFRTFIAALVSREHLQATVELLVGARNEWPDVASASKLLTGLPV
jgi:hypothetical protein